MKKRLLFRVDGGNVWGVSMGHLKRSLILAEHLKNDFEIFFVMKNYPDGVSYVKEGDWQIYLIDPNDESDEPIIKLCEQLKPDTVIFDLNSNYYAHFFEYAKLKKIRTIVFDITGKCDGTPDIIINDSFVPELIRYPLVSQKTKIYTGPDYFIMDNAPAIMPVRQTVEEILITFGGSDPADLTFKLLKSTFPAFKNYNLSIVLGPAYSKPKRIRELLNGTISTRVYINPPDFLSLLSRADTVITAAGRTLYECAYFGRPAIIIPSIEHEVQTAKEFGRITGSIDVSIWDAMNRPGKIKDALCEFTKNYELRKHIFDESRKIVDGNGLIRVMKLINP